MRVAKIYTQRPHRWTRANNRGEHGLPIGMIKMILVAILAGALGIGFVPTTVSAQSNSIVTITNVNGAMLRDLPDGPVAQVISAGQPLDAVGRSADQGWIAVRLTDGTDGWIATDQLIIFGVARLPVIEVSAATTDSAGAPSNSNDSSVSTGMTGTETMSSTVANTSVISTTTVPTTSSETTDSRARTSDSTTAIMGTVTLNNSRLNVRSGPSTGYAIVAKANAGDTLPVIGRNEAGDWMQVTLSAAQGSEASGWVAARYLALSGTLDTVPVIAVSSSPSVQATTAQATAAQTSTIPVSTATTDTTQLSTGNRPTATGAGLNGTLVIQSSPGGTIYGYNLATGQLWTVSHGFDPAISPDGKTVAFVRDGGENGVYLVNIDGSNERLIFSGRTRLSSPKWSPDGNWILFTRSDEYSECIDTGRGCISPNALPPGAPTDGLTLSKDYEYNLARVDINGNNYRDIAALESARVADWNSAGIVYQSSAGLQITSDTADATNRLLLFTPLQPPVEDPDWQPNGGKVAFVQHHGSHYEIFAINPDGSGSTPLTRPVTTLVEQMPNNVAPAWSPDGQHIVFLINREANNEAGAWRVWVMDADGGNQRALPIELSINYTYGNEQAVDWAQ